MKKPAALHWLLLFLAVLCGLSLFNHGPVPSMEPRFAEAVREMLARHEFLVPIKNGLPYIEYPPLYFWLSLAGAALGLSIEAAVRLPGYVALLLWVVWLARLQKELFPTWPKWLLPLTGAAMPAVIYNFFTAQSDSLLILGTLVAFTGYIRIRTDPPLRKFPWELWLGVALATAAKGPVGIAVTLPVMGLEIAATAYLTLQADTGEPKGFVYRTGRLLREALRMCPGRGILVALVGILPWYLAAGYSLNWDFVRAVLVYQNFTRFFVGFDHLQPWWLYAQTIWGDLLPLSVLIPFGLYYGFRYVRREFRWRLLIIWSAWTVLFFTLSASKQSKYILPAAPAMALLGLAAIEPMFKSDKLHGIVRSILGGFAVAVLALFAVGVTLWVPMHDDDRITHASEFHRITAAAEKDPGALVSFQWPRSLTLYELGGPMAYVRSSRELYAKIHSGEIRPGDYILVTEKYMPLGSEQDPEKFVPAPDPKYFEQVMKIRAEDPMFVFRVKPAAATMSVPATPEPAPLQWWNQFDTD
jgi:4-amino-4-deoxy-L-arabinose transferase-like glycosyltransferase